MADVFGIVFWNDANPDERAYVRADDFDESTRRYIAAQIAGIGELWKQRRLECEPADPRAGFGSSPYGAGRPLLPTDGAPGNTYPR